MESFAKLIIENQSYLLFIGLIVLLVIGLFVFLYVKAYYDGRDISFYPPKIGPRGSINNKPQIEHKNEIEPQNLIKFKIYLHRNEIHWKPYNEKVKSRFWACGTSLIGVSERKLFQKFYQNKGIRDIKIILPDTELYYSSYMQLDQFDKFLTYNLVYNQVQAATESYKRLKNQIDDLIPKSEEYERYLRKYCGIMYSNITLYDDEALISFYDSTGVGDTNITIHLNKELKPNGYKHIEDEFLKMWTAEINFGIIGKKQKGASIIFLNSANQILLLLRDKKQGIPYPNCWDILGGHVEEGENPRQCIIREIMEEIEISLNNPLLWDVYDMDDRIDYIYWQRADFGISNITLNEGQGLRWFDEKEIYEMSNNEIAFNFKEIILDFYRNINILVM